MAWFYFAGISVKRDIQKALDYFFELANQKHVQSALFIGKLYLEGKTLPKDVNKALKYINIGIEQNDPEAQYDLGLIYMKGSNGPIDISIKQFIILNLLPNKILQLLNLILAGYI